MKHSILHLLVILCTTNTFCQSTNWGEQFSAAIVKRYQPTIDIMTHKGWDHSNSIILNAMSKIYEQDKRQEYLLYIQTFVDDFVDENGNVMELKPELDGIHPGLLCLFLYEETGLKKYKTAATQMRNYLLGTTDSISVFSKTPDGGYWHKNNDHYENVMTIDGAYMANPFLVKYGALFKDQECMDVATFQTLLIASRTFNIVTHLPFHGWDYSKHKSWASPITGTSTQIWSRSIGWFSMALADILEFLPSRHPDYQYLVYLFQQLAIGIQANQNSSDGMWYQVPDKIDAPNNYPETSGSGMIIYALHKGVEMGWIDASYEKTAELGWEGMQKYISVYSDGLPQINSFAPGMGIKDDLEEYVEVLPVSCPSATIKQHPHGYCGILMAASEMENRD